MVTWMVAAMLVSPRLATVWLCHSLAAGSSVRPGRNHHVHLRSGPRPHCRQPCAAVAGVLPDACRADLPEPRGGDPWRAPVHLCPIPRAVAAAGVSTGTDRRREGGYGRDHGAEHPAD